MDLFLIVIILALLATIVTMLLGLISMGEAGGLDKKISTPIMWARVGLQGLTVALLFGAILFR